MAGLAGRRGGGVNLQKLTDFSVKMWPDFSTHLAGSVAGTHWGGNKKRLYMPIQWDAVATSLENQKKLANRPPIDYLTWFDQGWSEMGHKGPHNSLKK